MTFEVQKRHLISHEAAFLAIYQCLGGLDAALSIASYRKSLPYYADPELDHAAPTPYLNCQDVVHPLVTRCVPNSIALDHSMLLTGSNAIRLLGLMDFPPELVSRAQQRAEDYLRDL